MGSGGELWLPEPAIERIQYFLDSNEAAQTIILSKSWYNVWLLRPKLDFDHDDHYAYDYDLSHEDNRQIYHEAMEQFLEFADKTLNRYKESNLKIQSFKLCMQNKFYYSERDYGLGHNELIERALEIGVTHLTLRVRYGPGNYVLTDKVFESAVNLTLIRCNFNPKPRVTCSRLQSLTLDSFELKNPDTISHILLSCPLIQNLSLHTISLEKPADYYISYYSGLHYGHSVVNDYGGYYDNYPTIDYGYITKPHMRLRTLVLKYVYFDMLFLGDLSSKFPLLKDLTLFMSLKKYQEEILISSTSLEHLNFKLKNNDTSTRSYQPFKRQRVTFDFPSICKFTYVGSVIPLLMFESNSRGWESHVSIRRRHKSLTTSWFCRLSDFLTKLRRSRVSLSLHVRCMKSINYEAGDIQGLPTSEIERLNIDHEELPSLTCYALLDFLFRICHPKLITQSVSKSFRVKKKHIDLLGQVLVNGVLDHGKNTLTPSHFMYGLNDLKEARAQIIDRASVISTWRDVPLDALLEQLKSTKGKQEVRFQLNWQPTTTNENFYLKMSNQKIQELDNDPVRVRNSDKEKGRSQIEYTRENYCMERVCKTFIENSGSGEVASKIKHLLRLLHQGFPESVNDDDANKFSCMIYEVFREPCFVNAVRAVIEKYQSFVHCAEDLLNNDSPTERVAHMKADWCLKPTLMSLRSDTTNIHTFKVFLFILLGHWADDGEFRELDKRIGKNYFGDHFDYMARCKSARARLNS